MIQRPSTSGFVSIKLRSHIAKQQSSLSVRSKYGYIHKPDARFNRGDVREDGMIFLNYQKDREIWVDKERFEYEINCYLLRRMKQVGPRKGESLFSYRFTLGMYETQCLAYRVAKLRKEASKDHSSYYAIRKDAVDSATPKNAWKIAIRGCYDIARRVSRCLGIVHHVDHIMPINVGGLHDISNLQIIPAIWNLRKNDNPNYELPDCYLTPARLMSR